MLWRNVWVYVLLFAFFTVTACNHDEKLPPSAIGQPNRKEINQVIQQFLNRDEPVPFRMWTTVDGEIVASMAGITEDNKWELEGKHNRRSFVQLSGRQNKVEWKTKKASGVLEHQAFGLYSPHEHLKQLKGSFDNLKRIPANRFQSDWTAIQMSLRDEEVKRAVQTKLGEQFVTPDIAQTVAHKMEVRYTLWYNKRSDTLHQIKMEAFEKADRTQGSKQSLIFLFEESSD